MTELELLGEILAGVRIIAAGVGLIAGIMVGLVIVWAFDRGRR